MKTEKYPDISERREESEGGKSERSVRGIRVRRERVTTREQSTSEEEVDTQPNTSRSSKKCKRDEDPLQERKSFRHCRHIFTFSDTP